MYFSVLPPINSEVIIARCAFATSKPLVTVFNDSNGTYWRLRDGAGTIRQSTSTLSAGVWYCLELKAVVGDESALFVDGTRILTGTAPSGSSSTFYLMTYAYYGVPEGTEVYFDSVEASDEPIGLLNSTIPVTDGFVLAEAPLASKVFCLADVISLEEQAQIASKLKPVLDNVASAEGLLANKILLVTEDSYLVDVAEVGKGDRRTRLFLVFGDIAIQLTGYL